MATTTIKNGAGADVTVELPLAPGRAAAAASRPVTLSVEDAAFLDGLEGFLGTIAGAISGGRMLTSPAALVAGTNIIGRVGIDQTTDGTTNLVAAKQNGTWTISTVTPGTAATNLGKAIDSVAGSTDTGVALLATRLDTLATLTPASGDYASPRVNARGALWAALDPNFAAVGGFTAVKDITLTTDTSAYSAGDLIAETQVVSGAARITNGTGQITQIVVVDEADQKAQLTVYFLSANNTFGTENALPSISDANAGAILGRVRVEVADYDDLGGVSVAAIPCAIPFAAVSGTSDLYVAVVNGAGAPTYAATSLKLRVGIQQD